MIHAVVDSTVRTQDWLAAEAIGDRRGHELACVALLDRLAAFDGRLYAAGLRLVNAELVGDFPATRLSATVADCAGGRRVTAHAIWSGPVCGAPAAWHRTPARVVRDLIGELIAH